MTYATLSVAVRLALLLVLAPSAALAQVSMPSTQVMCDAAQRFAWFSRDQSVHIFRHEMSPPDFPALEGVVQAGYALDISRFRDPFDDIEKIVASGVLLEGISPQAWPESFARVDFAVMNAAAFDQGDWRFERNHFPWPFPTDRDRQLLSAVEYLRYGERADHALQSDPADTSLRFSVFSPALRGWYLCQSCRGGGEAFRSGGQDIRDLRVAIVEHHLVFFTFDRVLGGAAFPNSLHERTKYFICPESSR